MDLIPDLVSLLKQQNQEVRFEASKLLSPFATEHAGRQKMLEHDAVTVLIRLLGDITPIAHHALVMLINLSEDAEAVRIMLKKGLVSTIADSIVEEKNKYIALQASLLSNLTLQKEGIEQTEKIGFRAFKLAKSLLTAYLQSPEKNHTIGLALVNITQVECVRTACLDDSIRPLIIQLFTYKIELAPEKAHVRRTLNKITRNICFAQKFHKMLITEIDIIPILLSPLRGPEVMSDDDKSGMHPSLHEGRERETNTACQLLLLDALHLLTSTRFGRVALRDGKAYPIMREFDKTVPEEDEDKKQAILQVVDSLIADEGDIRDEFDTPAPDETPIHSDKKNKVEDDMEEI